MRFLTLRPTVLIILLCAVSISSVAQSMPKVRVYTMTDSRRAAKEIKKQLESDPGNALWWNKLALELLYQNKSKDAVGAITKAVSIEPSNADYLSNLKFAHLKSGEFFESRSIDNNPIDANAYFARSISETNTGKLEAALEDVDNAIIYSPKFAAAYALKSDILVTKFQKTRSLFVSTESLDYLRESVKVLEQCHSVCDVEKAVLKKAIDERRSMISYFEKSIGGIDADKANPDEPLKIVSKPRPRYTNIARRLSLYGTVQLAVIFDSDGTIGPILVLKGSPGGLTASSVEAAMKIQFEPERKGGKHISVVKIIVYRFSLY